ncbi:MAG: hypothetical protein LBM59_03580 [Ruminococcus sp.]|jgi:ABC-type glycerol-3-phosphate transport system substrate-binding protein|nr:hypothetical protein [Ruminococcus sp.]
MVLKKFAALACAALLMGGVFSGCARVAPNAPKDNIFESKMIIQSGEDFDNVSNIIWDGTNIYFTAQKRVQKDFPIDGGGSGGVPPTVRPLDDVLVVAETEMVVDEAEIAESTVSPEDYKSGNYITTVTNYTYIIKADLSGNILGKNTLSQTTNEDNTYIYYSSLMTAPGGTVYGVKQISSYGTDENGEYYGKEETQLVSFDSLLKETLVQNLTELLVKEIANSEGYVYINNSLMDASGILYLNTGMNVFAVEPATGKILLNYSVDPMTSGGAESVNIQDICMMPDGSVGVILSSYTVVKNDYIQSITISKINTAAGKLDSPQDFPISYNAIPGVGDYSFFATDSSAIYGYSKDMANRTVIADLLASAIADISVNNLVPITAEKFLITGYSNYDNASGIYLLTKVDPATITEKKLVKVAAISNDYGDLTQFIRYFNKNNAQHQVQYKSYMIDANTTYTQAMTAFNNDIISGNIPDVIVVSRELPYDSYAAKGLLMDLKTRLADDPDLRLEDLVPSVIDKLSVEGKLYSLSPTFTLQVLSGKTSIFGEDPGQTLDELLAKAAEYPGASLFDPTTTRDDFMVRFVYNYIGSYIDDATGKCYFDTPEFISLLEMAKTMPETFDYENYDWMASYDGYRENKFLLEFTYLNDFRGIVREELVTFGEPITYMGYPGREGETGIIASLGQEMAIMAKAKNPDGAWEFLKSFITYKDPQVQDYTTSRGVYPILQEELEKYAAEALERPFYYEYKTNNKVYYDNTAFINNQEVKIPDNTAADNAKVMAVIDNISSVQRVEYELQTIIQDDITAFFKNQKSAADTAKIIQDRASTYITESR